MTSFLVLDLHIGVFDMIFNAREPKNLVPSVLVLSGVVKGVPKKR